MHDKVSPIAAVILCVFFKACAAGTHTPTHTRTHEQIHARTHTSLSPDFAVGIICWFLGLPLRSIPAAAPVSGGLACCLCSVTLERRARARRVGRLAVRLRQHLHERFLPPRSGPKVQQVHVKHERRARRDLGREPSVPIGIQRSHEDLRSLSEQHPPDRAVDPFHHLVRPDDELEGPPAVTPGAFYGDVAGGLPDTAAAAAAAANRAAAPLAALAATVATVAFLQRADVVDADDVADVGKSALVLPLENNLRLFSFIFVSIGR